MVTELKRLKMKGKEYFIDERLNQIRNVDNPHDFEDVSPELIHFWVHNCRQEKDNLICNLDKLGKTLGKRYWKGEKTAEQIVKEIKK